MVDTECEPIVAAQLFKRLQVEGKIVLHGHEYSYSLNRTQGSSPQRSITKELFTQIQSARKKMAEIRSSNSGPCGRITFSSQPQNEGKSTAITSTQTTPCSFGSWVWKKPWYVYTSTRWSHTHLIHRCWLLSRTGVATSHRRYPLISPPQNRASKPTTCVPRGSSPFGEISRVTMGPDATSVNSWRTITNSQPSARCRPKSGCSDYQTEEGITKNAANSPISVSNERKRKSKVNAAEDINGELSARKKIKISTVPAVDLYD